MPACLIVDLQMDGMTGLEPAPSYRYGVENSAIVVTARDEPASETVASAGAIASR
jgi:CheY-like chemotaxis protein